MAIPADWLRPDWQLPGIGALMTTRAGGVGQGRFASLNLRYGMGDAADTVVANQARLMAVIGAEPVWLNQVHGTRVVRLTGATGLPTPPIGAPGSSHDAVDLPTADASVTTVPGIACAVQIADCLPVLFAAPGARAVGAAHAGWRGLAAGVLEATVAAVCEAGDCRPAELQAWLGACIGPRNFEVGEDVVRACADPQRSAASDRMALADDRPRFRPHAQGKWLADLPQLARDRLAAAGLRLVSGGDDCTVESPSRFFSFRRDGVTGRMAAVIWIEHPAGR